ncbi:MAG: hypothetical protein ABGY10_07475, partial [bacterium]
KQLANDSSTEVVMHQAPAGEGEHFDTGTGDGLGDRGGEANDIFPELAIAPTTPAATPETTTPVVPTPTTATTPTTTTTTPSTTTTPTSTSGGGRQAANDPEPDPAPPPQQIANNVIVETIIPPEVEPVAADGEQGDGRECGYREACLEAAEAASDPKTEEAAAGDVVEGSSVEEDVVEGSSVEEDVVASYTDLVTDLAEKALEEETVQNSCTVEAHVSECISAVKQKEIECLVRLDNVLNACWEEGRAKGTCNHKENRGRHKCSKKSKADYDACPTSSCDSQGM